MNDRGIGSAIRRIRQSRRLRQLDLASAAKVSQTQVSEMELGRLEHLSLAAMRRIGAALDVTIDVNVRWNGGDLHRLMDETHAAIVEYVVGVLRSEGWEVRVEEGFNRYGDRGSVDIVGWHPASRTLLLIEVKSAIVDLQDLFSSFARKLRIVPGVLAEREGWHAAKVARLLVVLGTSTNRRRVDAHRATFETTFPQRARNLRAWLRRPVDDLAALWFVSPTALSGTRRTPGRGGRVRRAAGGDSPATQA